MYGAGCHARCPGFHVGCIGCRGPVEDANYEGLRAAFRRIGMPDADIERRLHMFVAPSLQERCAEIHT